MRTELPAHECTICGLAHQPEALIRVRALERVRHPRDGTIIHRDQVLDVPEVARGQLGAKVEDTDEPITEDVGALVVTSEGSN